MLGAGICYVPGRGESNPSGIFAQDRMASVTRILFPKLKLSSVSDMPKVRICFTI